MNSALGSMKRRMSQGQAIRSIFGRSRVTHLPRLTPNLRRVGRPCSVHAAMTENIPSLAGQPDQFIKWQLVFFRGGARKNEQMQPIAEQVTNEDIRLFGAYFNSLTPLKPSA